MPLPIIAAGIVGGSILAGATVRALGARSQQKAAEKAAEKAGQRAVEGAAAISSATNQGRSDIETGAQSGQDFLEQGVRQLGDQKQEVTDIFQQERDVGGRALTELEQLLLNDGEGLQERVQSDPAFQFRLAEGNKAIERAARAAGSFGGGANLKDFARFGQGLASSEADKIVARLMGLQGIGANANRSQAQLGTSLAGGIAQQRSNQSNLAANTGLNLANLTQSGAIGQANALNQGTTASNNLSLQAANASAQQFNAAGQAFQDIGTLAALSGVGGGGGATVSDPNTVRSITTSAPNVLG